MSTAAKGNARVDSVCRQLAAAGYVVAPIKASGRRGDRRLALATVPGDILAFPATTDSTLPSLQVEAGGISKRIGAAFAELRAVRVPTCVPLVARCVSRRWRWHIGEDRTESFPTLGDALDALRDGAGS